MAAPFPSPIKNWHTETYPSLAPTRPELSAKGKTVVVTGGGTGIGAETARYFAEAGASRIALLGRREQPLLDTKASIEHEFANVEVFAASTDITNKSQVDAAFAKFVGDGKIHVMISSAAIVGPQDSVEDVDAEKFVDAIHANIKGSLNVAQAFLRYAATDAVVVDVSSGLAYVDLGPGSASYSVSKMAVVRLWNSVAAANPELSIFHVQPGVVDTALNKETNGIATLGFEDHVSLPASFHVWLASPEASFLKGKFVWANWDVNELKAQAKEIEGTTKFSIGQVGWPFLSEGR